MLIPATETITEPLYQGPLSEESSHELRSDDEPSLREEIQVSIGRPDVWSVAEANRVEGISPPAPMSLLLKEADYWVARFPFTFWIDDRATVENASVRVELQHTDGEIVPTTHDLAPREVVDEIQRSRRIAIAPSVKFAELVEGTLGEYALEIQSTEIVPTVRAFGLGESKFGWRAQDHGKHPLQTTTDLLAVVRAPFGCGPVSAQITVRAQVRTARRLLRATRLPQTAATTLVLWS